MEFQLKFVVTCAFLSCLSLIDSAPSGKGSKGKEGNSKKCMMMPAKGKRMQCKGEEARLDMMKPHMEKCNQDAGETSPETKYLKMKVCVWEGVGAVRNNKFNQIKFEEYIMAMYPGTIGEELSKTLSTCITPQNTNGLSKDDNCKSYKPLLQCLTKSMMKYCKQTH